MPRMIYDYTKTELERKSFDPVLFKRELKKAMKNLLPYEIELLKKWLKYFISNNPNPELETCCLLLIQN